MSTRASYQQGSLRKVERKRGPMVWEYRFREPATTPGALRTMRNIQVGTVKEYRTAAAARKALDAMRLKVNEPSTRLHHLRITVGQLIEHYKAKELGADRPGKAETTCDIYRFILKNWIEPKWGSYRLLDIKTAEVEEWLRAPMQSKASTPAPLAPGTRGKIRNIFSALFSHAIRWEFIDRNPITGPSRGSGVRQTSKRLRTPDVLTAQEIAAILERLQPRERAIVFLAASTGFRASEMRGLQWQDVDFDACTINLRRGVVGKHVGETKTAGSRRLVPISPELAAVLTQLRAASGYNQPGDWILASTDKQGKTPLWLDTLMERKIRPAVAAAKIAKRVTWHVFRHSYATLLKGNGEDVKTVQESLRHATVRMTMETYTQAIPEHVRQAQERVSGQLVAAAGNVQLPVVVM
jgi:integrase